MSCLTACPSGHRALDPQRSDDELIAYTLIWTWALITGRSPRHDVPIDQLDERELLEFWADPLTAGEGSHI